MMHSLFNLSVWLFLLAVAIGAGYVIRRMLRVPASPWLDTVLISLALGLGLLIYGMAGLGALHLLRPSFVLAWLLVVAALALWGGWQIWQQRAEPRDDKTSEPEPTVYPMWGIYLALGGFAIAYLLSTMVPPLDGDTLHSYLDIPRQYVDAGGIIPLPYELHAALPMNIQMLSALALVVAGDEVAQMLAGFTMAVGAASVIFALGRRYLSREVGGLAALIFFSMNVVQSLVPTTKVNLGCAFFDLLAVYAVCRWAFDPVRNNHWILPAGILSGLALGTQYPAGFTSVLLALAIVVVLRREGLQRLFQHLIAYGFPVLLLGGPWVIKNFLEVGNPISPILNPLFGLPAAEPIEHSRGLVGLGTILWDMATGYIAGSYGKPVGPVVLGALPGLVLIRPIGRKVKIALLFIGSLYLFWYIGVQRPRNFLTGLGVISLVSAYTYVILGRRSQLIRKGFVVLVTLFLLFNWVLYVRAYFVNLDYLSYVLGLESRDAFLQRTLSPSGAYPSGPMTDYMNTQLPADARIVAMYLGNGYYVQRPFIDSRMVDGDFMQDTAGGAEELITQWRTAGITHVFLNETYMRKAAPSDDPGLWPDDYKILRDPQFVSRCLTEIFVSGQQHLYELLCR